MTGNDLIKQYIEKSKPAAVGKIGTVELSLIYDHRRNSYNNTVQAYNNAGIYPVEDLPSFMRVYMSSLSKLNLLPIWNKSFSDLEKKICDDIKAIPIRLSDIEPYFHEEPWSMALKNKHVLVISPMARLIEDQYKKRTSIWLDNILPDFKLTTIQYPYAKAVDSSNSWNSTIEVINSVKKTMDVVDYDVCIIGAGAASIPLIAHAKDSNKIGIHMGGPTQILFGIRGARWDINPKFNSFWNDHWVYPEKPENANIVEGGCYW